MIYIQQYDDFINESLFDFNIQEIKNNIKKITNKESLIDYLTILFKKYKNMNNKTKTLLMTTIIASILTTSTLLTKTEIEEIEIKSKVEVEITFKGNRNDYFSLLSAQESGDRDSLGNPIPGTSNWKTIQWQKYKNNKFPAYIGKYQFGTIALVDVGVCKNNKEAKQFKIDFSKNPNIWPESEQEISMKKLQNNNSKYLKNYIDYIGKTINGILITESGLLAASHLVGNGNVIKFLKSNGEIIAKDGNNVPLTKYLSMFSNYDLKTK